MADLQTVYMADGTPIALAALGKEGGEGAIFSCPDRPGQCAKLFHERRITQELHEKIRVMVADPPDDPMRPRHHSIAWPQAVLYRQPGGSGFCGYLMPFLDESFREAHIYYDTQDRVRQFAGSFTWEHLLCAAWNLASAVAALHEKGHCIGDLREKNVLIAPDSLITLIDCDSFQILDSSSGKIYFSRVGSPEYLPPQLQKASFQDEDHDRYYSDLFALAVLSFRFLMQGFHPFQSRGAAVADANSTEAKIALGLYPYELGSDPQYAGRLYPPAFAPPYHVMPEQLRMLARRCFVDGLANERARPTAKEWYDALGKESARCQTCDKSNDHIFSEELTACPWCELSDRGMDDPFAEEVPKPPPAPTPTPRKHVGRQQQLRPATAAPPSSPSAAPSDPTSPPDVIARAMPIVFGLMCAYLVASIVASILTWRNIWVPVTSAGFGICTVIALFGGGKRFGALAGAALVIPLFCGLFLNISNPPRKTKRARPMITKIYQAHDEKKLAQKRQQAEARKLSRDLATYNLHCRSVFDSMVSERRRIADQEANKEWKKSRRPSTEVQDRQAQLREMESELIAVFDQEYAAYYNAQRQGATPQALAAKAAELELSSFFLFERLDADFRAAAKRQTLAHEDVKKSLNRARISAELAAAYIEREFQRLTALRGQLVRRTQGTNADLQRVDDELLLLLNLGVRTLRHHNRPSFRQMIPAGTFIWTASTADFEENYSTELNKPVANASSVYVQTIFDRAVRAFDTQNGAMLWSQPQETGRTLAATLQPNGLFLQDMNRLTRLDALSGRMAWKLSRVSSSDRAACGRTVVAVASSDRTLSLAQASDSSQIGSTTVPADIIDICLSEDETVVYVATAAAVHAYTIGAQPQMLWERHLLDRVIMADGSLYRSSLCAAFGRLTLALNEASNNAHEARIHCLDPATGEDLWRKTGLAPAAGITVRGSSVGLLLKLGESLHMMDPQTGDLIWQYPFDHAVVDLATSDHILLAVTKRLHCLSLMDGRKLWEVHSDGLVQQKEYTSLLHPGDIVPQDSLQFPQYKNAGITLPDLRVAARPTIDGFVCQPAVVNNRIYFYGAPETLYCLWAGDLSSLAGQAPPSAIPHSLGPTHVPAPGLHNSVVP